MKYLVLILIFAYSIKYIISFIIRKKKASRFINTFFVEDRLYSVEEVSNAFRLDKDYFLSLLTTLEKHNYFSFFNKRGVTLVKDFYSKYELVSLVNILLKKKKL